MPLWEVEDAIGDGTTENSYVRKWDRHARMESHDENVKRYKDTAATDAATLWIVSG